ncbi:hypothetical protein CHARACLAT_027584 [Characodon lateralis]|uniref:Secreted protein n=1 Tax=Characodon lateralis TaxID=208331 RepID=A0ABU7D3G6_9TELE|nr:hypothetical protein [Characodon lateralis]
MCVWMCVCVFSETLCQSANCKLMEFFIFPTKLHQRGSLDNEFRTMWNKHISPVNVIHFAFFFFQEGGGGCLWGPGWSRGGCFLSLGDPVWVHGEGSADP